MKAPASLVMDDLLGPAGEHFRDLKQFRGLGMQRAMLHDRRPVGIGELVSDFTQAGRNGHIKIRSPKRSAETPRKLQIRIQNL